jgi:hypothetical protein
MFHRIWGGAFSLQHVRLTPIKCFDEEHGVKIEKGTSAQEDNYCVIPLVWGSRIGRFERQEGEAVTWEAGQGVGEGELVFKGNIC